MIAPRHEGGLPEPDSRSSIAPFWRNLDRNVPLGFKLIMPVVVVTLTATLLFAGVLAQNTRSQLEATYRAAAQASAQGASKAFYATISNPAAVDPYLMDVASAQPDVKGIWIVNVVIPGQPVVASSIPSDLGRTGMVDAVDVNNMLTGQSGAEIRNEAGHDTLETIYPVTGDAFGVVVWTSLDRQNQAISDTIWRVTGVALILCLVEVAAMVILLEYGVLRRIRRVGQAVTTFKRGYTGQRLSEGSEPEGRDALFNLARHVDHKLAELGERERAGGVVNELGLLALQGMPPDDLTRKALEITRVAANLERCFLVFRGRPDAAVDSYDGGGERTERGKLPIWVVSLVRAAILARKPVLADTFGQDCRYWATDSEAQGDAAAAFVPLAGTPEPLGVIVAIARPGKHITHVSLPLIEAVATALGESLQRSEVEKARHESNAMSNALATVSHEMRNPLSAMLGFSDLLLAGAAGKLNEKQEAYVRRVDEASRHLLNLVKEYLDLANIMNGSVPVKLETLVIGAEVRSVLDLLRATADEKGVALHIEATSAVARADRMRLRQVLMNLVSNAVKFTRPKGHVRVEVAGGSNGVRISVIDTGIGIPADQQHLVFTEFAPLGANGTEHGAGLGLALTKRLVESMGGFIKFSSSEGAGTIFDVWLPGDQSPNGPTREGAPAPDGSLTAVRCP